MARYRQPVEVREFASGAALLYSRGPWASLVGARRVLCPDGKRRYAVVTGEPDTFFSVPARVTVAGRSVSGFVATDNDQDVCFTANPDGKNAALLPDWPPTL